jgi:hypothetical protein
VLVNEAERFSGESFIRLMTILRHFTETVVLPEKSKSPLQVPPASSGATSHAVCGRMATSCVPSFGNSRWRSSPTVRAVDLSSGLRAR